MSDEQPAQQNLTSRQACELIERLTGQKPTSDQLRQWCRQGYIAPQELSPITLSHVRNRQGHYELTEEGVREFIKRKARREIDLVAFVKWCKRRSAVHRAKKIGATGDESDAETPQSGNEEPDKPQATPPQSIPDPDAPESSTDRADARCESLKTSTVQLDCKPAPSLVDELRTATIEIETGSQSLTHAVQPMGETPIAIPQPLPETATVTIKPATDHAQEGADSASPESTTTTGAIQTKTVSVPMIEEAETTEQAEFTETLEDHSPDVTEDGSAVGDESQYPLPPTDQQMDELEFEDSLDMAQQAATSDDAAIENESSFANGIFEAGQVERDQDASIFDLEELVAAEMLADPIEADAQDDVQTADESIASISLEDEPVCQLLESLSIDEAAPIEANEASDSSGEDKAPAEQEVGRASPAFSTQNALAPGKKESQKPKQPESGAECKLTPTESNTSNSQEPAYGPPESKSRPDAPPSESAPNAVDDDFAAGIDLTPPLPAETESPKLKTAPDPPPPPPQPPSAPKPEAANKNGTGKSKTKSQVPVPRPVVVKPLARKVETKQPDDSPGSGAPSLKTSSQAPGFAKKMVRRDDLDSLARAYAQFSSGNRDGNGKSSDAASESDPSKSATKASPVSPAIVDADADSLSKKDNLQAKSQALSVDVATTQNEGTTVALESPVDTDIEDLRSDEPRAESESDVDEDIQPQRRRARPVVQASRFLWAWVGAILIGGAGFGLSFLINDPFGAVALSSVAVAATGMSGLWWIGK